MTRRSGSCPALRVVGLAVTCLASQAFAQAVYRCDDGKGGVLYTDAPCRQGAQVDLLPGRADPVAIERLQREQKAFDERHAVREARLRAEAQAAREAQRKPAEAPPAPVETYAYPPWAWGGWTAWPPVPPRPPRPPPPPEPAPYVPAKPPPRFAR